MGSVSIRFSVFPSRFTIHFLPPGVEPMSKRISFVFSIHVSIFFGSESGDGFKAGETEITATENAKMQDLQLEKYIGFYNLFISIQFSLLSK